MTFFHSVKLVNTAISQKYRKEYYLYPFLPLCINIKMKNSHQLVCLSKLHFYIERSPVPGSIANLWWIRESHRCSQHEFLHRWFLHCWSSNICHGWKWTHDLQDIFQSLKLFIEKMPSLIESIKKGQPTISHTKSNTWQFHSLFLLRIFAKIS